MSDRPYSRIYHELAEEYPEIYDGPLLADYLRLLVSADQAHPTRARWAGFTTKRALSRLEQCGLIVVEGPRFSVKGMDKERAIRAEKARRAGVASHAPGSARSSATSTARTDSPVLPRRDETSKDETRRALSAREGLPNITPEVQQAGEVITGTGILSAGDKQLTELDRLCELHGSEEVMGAMQAVANGKRKSWRQLVWDSMKLLEPFSSSKAPTEDDEIAELHRKDMKRFAEYQRQQEADRA